MIAWFAAQPLVFKIFLGGLGSLLLLFLLWRLWLWLRKYLEWQNVKSLEIEKRVGIKIEFIKTAAQILGGAFFLVTIWVAWQNLVVSQEKYKTDLFTQAIDQLGNVNQMEVRLGGIYALERIARDSEKDHGPIMEVLTAFVRLHAPWTPEKAAEDKKQQDKTKKPPPGKKKSKTEGEKIKPRADIQAILTVLGRRARTYKKEGDQRLDLRQTDLRGARLRGAHLEGAHLGGAQLEGANLTGAHLNEAGLELADLKKGIGLKADQVRKARKWVLAYLPEELLEKLDLTLKHNQRLAKKNLSGYQFVDMDLRWANFQGFNLEEAVLNGARLEGACFHSANLEKAHLEGADLRYADGLTKEQIDSAFIDKNTKLDYHLKKADPDKANPQ
jgi:uncharacterized protein YjbI with pentapeptide repeats